MRQIFTEEEVEYIRAVGMKLIAGEELTREESDRITELSNRLAEETQKQDGGTSCGE